MSAPADARTSAGIGLVALSAGAIGWSFCCAGLALAGLWRTERLDTFHLSPLLMVFAGGAALAWLASAAVLLLLRRRVVRLRLRLPLAFVILGAATLAFTALLFALDYRAFYARWHADAFTLDWTLQQLFTTASATYQFLVIGLRLYLPLGPLLLAAATPVLLRATR
ncbi:hypothetical protein AAIH46_01530 [Rhizobium sp. 0TCS1.26]|uniref:hypothetical protein n=1 Tax=Rhizobium sp. 0TCS1.26 TaxID=3142623 RepID=UPI003D2DA490